MPIFNLKLSFKHTIVIIKMAEVEIPTAREIPIIIVVAEPIVEQNRPKWKCKITFFTPMCVLFLAI